MARKFPYTNPDYVLEMTGNTVTLVQCDAASAIIDQHLNLSSSSLYGGRVLVCFRVTVSRGSI
jgi:hypothetical protein